jgi:hypothetical protein
MRWLVFSLVSCFFFLKAQGHDYYFSISEVFYNTSTQKFEISIKVHAHDMEHVFEDNKSCWSTIKNGEFQPESDICLDEYFTDNFKIFSSKGKEIHLTFIGKEQKLDGNMFIYFESSKFKWKKSDISIENTILTEINPSQQNIVHLNNDKEKNNTQTSYFSSSQKSATFSFLK